MPTAAAPARGTTRASATILTGATSSPSPSSSAATPAGGSARATRAGRRSPSAASRTWRGAGRSDARGEDRNARTRRGRRETAVAGASSDLPPRVRYTRDSGSPLGGALATGASSGSAAATARGPAARDRARLAGHAGGGDGHPRGRG